MLVTSPADARTRTRCTAPTRRRLDRVAAVVGALAVLAALVTIWAARATVGESVYVSQLGAPGMPTAAIFNAALLLLATGGALTALALRGARADVRLLSAWTVSSSLAASAGAFAVASRVTCTPGCPVPLTAGASAQDLVHVVAAVVGFATAGWAMLQVAGGAGVARGAGGPSMRRVRWGSGITAAAVVLVASVGGLLSIAGVGTDVGANLEFVAMTLAVLWLVAIAGARAVAPVEDDRIPPIRILAPPIEGAIRCEMHYSR